MKCENCSRPIGQTCYECNNGLCGFCFNKAEADEFNEDLKKTIEID